MFDRRGFIPGPQESKGAFEKRCQALLAFFECPKEGIDHFLTDPDWEGALLRVEKLYGCRPDWIVAHYSNEGLCFFQGAATWIDTRDGVRIPLIRLRESFDSGSLLKIYSRDEVLSHECVHAMRMQFDEPIFEEFFAYKTSNRLYRRLLGPLFQRPWEAGVFLFSLPIPFVFEFLWWIPLSVFAILTLRLGFLHLVLHRAICRLKSFLKDPSKALAAALRLTDREIFRLAFSSKNVAKSRSWE